MVCTKCVLDKALLVLSVFLVASWKAAGEDDRIPLRILGLFPYRGSAWNGEYVIPAVRLARDEINNNSDILPNCKLELIEANSGCARDNGTWKFTSNTLDVPIVPVAILGAGCSSSTIPIASVAGRNDIRIPQLSYGATSILLTFKHAYPYFYRTVPTDSFTTVARVKLMEVFNWKRYGIHNAGIGGSNQLVTEHAIISLRVEAERHIPDSKEVYTGDSRVLIKGETYKDQLAFTEDIFSSQMRIGQLYGVRNNVRDFFCFLYHHKLTYPRVIWMLSNQGGNWYNNNSSNCSLEEIRQATHGVIHFDYQLNTSHPNDTIGVTNKTFMEFYEDYIKEVRKYADEVGDTEEVDMLRNSWATVAYDSMWTLGLALDKAEKSLNSRNLTLRNFSLGNNMSSTILEELEGIDFDGTSGKIKFDKERKRELRIAVHQVQYGNLITIGTYFPSHDTTVLGELQLNDSALLWPLDKPPLDDFSTDTVTAHKWAVTLMFILLVVGFVWNSFSLFVNFRYQHFHSIKASSPPLNHVIFAGNYMLLLGGIVTVIKSMSDDVTTSSVLCRSRIWLCDLGLFLVLNTTLLKSWRIYRIFHSFVKKPGKMITDTVFMAVTIGWILFNTVCRIVFTLVDDEAAAVEIVLPLEGESRQRIVYCRQFEMWGLFFAPHFAIGVVLCLLAFSIRKIKHKQYNDATNIAIFFYSTTPVAAACGALSFVFSPAKIYNLTPAMMLICVSISCIVLMCQLTLFVPKMLPLFRQWRIPCHRYFLYF